ncbi:MAG: HD domain-containing protein, partial [Victivallales bacterium]|nr:HD domain-containing protein [Victivallales bacterium]
FPVGVIDLGAHSSRLDIFQKNEEGVSELLESMELPVNLGQDAFLRGTISPGNMGMITAIMKDFRLKMREYGVRKYRAIATSAVREAQNKDIFIDRIRSVSNVHIEVLEACLEARLMYLALKNELKEKLQVEKHDIFFLSIGTGSSNVAFSSHGKLQDAKMFNFGIMRLRDEDSGSGGRDKYLKGLINTFAESLERLLSGKKSGEEPLFICAGAGVRLLLNIVNRNRKSEADFISLRDLDDLTEQFSTGSKYHIDGEILPAPYQKESIELLLQLVRQICYDFHFSEVKVAMFSTRQALVEDMMRDMLETGDPFVDDMISVALTVGEKYNYEAEHADNTAALSMKIYNRTRHLHKLNERCGLLLRIAAILHDVGRFVDLQKHHKHSYYLISNSQLPGLSKTEAIIVPLIARYHRKSEPKAYHPEYMQLGGSERVVVCKLAAILRIADALDRGHHGRLRNSKIRVSSNCLLIEAPDKYGEYSLERFFLEKKQSMFCDIFGLKPEII